MTMFDYLRKNPLPEKYKILKPIVVHDDYREPTYSAWYTDPDIRKIRKYSVADSPINREWCFWNENICQTFSYIVSSSITGKRLRFLTENQKALEIIDGFNEQINFSGQTIEDFITDTFIDNIIHGYGVWRILETKDAPYGIDIARVKPRSLTPVYHKKLGYLKFIQRSEYNKQTPNTKGGFYSTKYRPPFDETTGTVYDAGTTTEIHIPVESTVFINLFKKPPIASALHYITYKRWILWYMRKAAEKFWSPTIWVKMGTEEFHPLDETEYEDAMKDLSRDLAKWSNFRAIVTPFDQEVKPIETKNKAEEYTTELNYLDEQIIFTLLGSIALIKASGVELATSKTIQEVWLRIIESLRRKYEIQLRKFYTQRLLPLHGINNLKDLTIDWSHLKVESNVEYVQMVNEVYDRGGFDGKQYIKALKVVFPWMKENVKIKLPPHTAKALTSNAQNPQKKPTQSTSSKKPS